MGEIRNLFLCMFVVHKIQQVCLALEARGYRVKASVPRNKPLVLTVNSRPERQPAWRQVRGTGADTGCGLCLRDVSRTVHWPLINASANWSSPRGVLLVCHKLLCCSFWAVDFPKLNFREKYFNMFALFQQRVESWRG